MAITKTITNDYEFAEWLKQSGNYQNNFTFEGANALQEYFEELSNEMDEDVEWDPVAWCVSYSEYADLETFKSDNSYTLADGVYHEGYPDIEDIDDLRDRTTVIEFDGGIIVEDF